MDLLKKVKPIYLDDLIFYQDQLKEAENWIHEYKNKINTTKKVLLLIGSTGSGKTLIANLLLEKFNYQIIEQIHAMGFEPMLAVASWPLTNPLRPLGHTCGSVPIYFYINIFI